MLKVYPRVIQRGTPSPVGRRCVNKKCGVPLHQRPNESAAAFANRKHCAGCAPICDCCQTMLYPGPRDMRRDCPACGRRCA